MKAIGHAWQSVLLTIALCATAWAGWWGWHWRDQVWAETASIRFVFDIQNAMNQGRAVIHEALTARAIARASTQPTTSNAAPAKPAPIDRSAASIASLTWVEFYRGYLAYYAAQAKIAHDVKAQDRNQEPSLDYPPLRLLVMSAWMKQVAGERGIRTRYRDELVGPLLEMNRWLAVVASVAVGCLVWRVRRDAGSAVGTAAMFSSMTAIAMWLNPALVINTHAWPQWDAWVVCGMVLAIALARWNYWTLAGMSLVMFAMFKGQLALLAIPMVVWALVWVREWAVVRLIAGGLIGMMIVVGPWFVQDRGTMTWVLASGACVAVAAWAAQRRWILVPLAGSTMAIAAVPGLIARSPFEAMVLCAAGLAMVLLAVLVKRLGKLTVIATAMSMATIYAGAKMDSSWDWKTVGFPTDRYVSMGMGPVTNVPMLLAAGWGWKATDTLEWAPQWAREWYGGEVTIRQLLQAITMVLLIVAGAMMGVQQRRKDVRFLAAAALPMVMVYLLLPQMHERYALYAAAATVMMIGIGVSGLLVAAGWTVLAGAMMLLCMIASRGWPADWASWSAVLLPLYPGLDGRGGPSFPAAVWGAIAMSLVVLVTALGRSARPVQPK
jgi:hypothetical protein